MAIRNSLIKNILKKYDFCGKNTIMNLALFITKDDWFTSKELHIKTAAVILPNKTEKYSKKIEKEED